MPDIHDYQTAQSFLDAGRNPSRRTIEDNTYLQKLPMGEIALIFYQTRIITYYQDGRIILNSGGFRTVTTKRRINRYQNDVQIWQRDFTWYVHTARDGHTPFTDHMNVGAAVLRLDRMHNQALSFD